MAGNGVARLVLVGGVMPMKEFITSVEEGRRDTRYLQAKCMDIRAKVKIASE